MGSRSSNRTTQEISNVDRRQALENSMGISGDNSSLVANSNNTTNADFSNRSTTTTNADFSNRSTSYSTVNNTVSDQGAIAAASQQVLAAITSNSNTVNTVSKMITESGANNNSSMLKVIDSSYKALGEKDHITADLVTQYASLQDNATKGIASAWQNAKNFESGKSMGDYKFVVYGVIAVFGLIAINSRKG